MHNEQNPALPEIANDRPLRDIALIILFGALLILPSFFTRDLWNPDEPRYTEVAREMVARGDYVVPHLDNVFYAEKPPLFFWLTAGFYKLGFGNLSGRTTAGMAMLGTLLLIYAFGRKRFDPRTGLLAAVMTATSLLFVGLMKTGVIDPLLTFLDTAAILAGYCALTGDSDRSKRWWLVFYAVCGLAMLTKGPVGFLVPLLVVAIFALFQRRKVSFGGWIHLVGILLMLTIFCAWLLPAMARGGKEYADALLHKPASYATREGGHAHGPHYYLMQLPALLLPWTFVFALALAQALRDWRKTADGDACFLSIWFIAVFVMFSAVSAKRERYLMPLMPAVGLLCARYYMQAARNGFPWPRLQRAFAVVLFVLLALTGVVVTVTPFIAAMVAAPILKSTNPEMLSHVHEILAKPAMLALVPTGLLIMATGVIGLTAARKRLWWLIGGGIGVVVAFSLVMDLALVPAVNPVKSSRTFCSRILPYMKEADRKYLFAGDYAGVINLHTQILDIPIIKISASEAGNKSSDHPRKSRNEVAVEALNRTFGQTGKVVVVSDEKQVAAFVENLPSNVKVIARERVGHRGMICLANWGEAESDAPADGDAASE